MGHRERPRPHYLRFARALALVTGAVGLAGCAGSAGGTPAPDASTDASPYDGFVTGVDTGVPLPGVAPMPDSGHYDGSVTGVDTGTCCGIMVPPDAASDAASMGGGGVLPAPDGGDGGGPNFPPELPA